MTKRAAPGNEAQAAAGSENARLLHELEVQQVELELQNDELRLARDEVRLIGDRYANLYQHAPVGYFTLDAGGRIAQVNLAGAGLLGLPTEALLGKPLVDFVAADDQQRYTAFLRNIALGSAEDFCELALRRPDNAGVVRFKGCLDLPTREFLIVAEDVTARKRIEQMLVEAKAEAERANRAKSAFLANMSHEIRTPLHIIVGLGHLLRRDLADPVQRQRIDQLCANSSHLLGLINDVLDLSRIEAEHLALEENDFRLGAVIERVLQVITPAARDKGLALTVDVAPRLRDAAVRGDVLRLSQVLINLSNNAVKFTERGAVRLVIEMLGADRSRMTLRFAVEDSGIGIAAADQARLFQAFSQIDNSATRAHGGSGLGLVISQRLVELMGGTIELDSRPGAGSSFAFTLDLPQAAGNPAPAEAELRPAEMRGRRVLFAEDQPLAQEILLEMLEDLGCEAEVAGDGLEALECAREREYDLIFLDMQMPKMDGLAAARAIRALPHHRATPIVALTASAFAEDRQRCLEAGMNSHLGKPVTPAALESVLSRWLGAEPSAAAPADPPACPTILDAVGADSHAELLFRFAVEHAGDMALARHHLAAGQHEAVRVLLHNLKGLAGLIGARQLAAAASELYTAVRAGTDAAALAPLIDACAAQLDAVVAEARRMS